MNNIKDKIYCVEDKNVLHYPTQTLTYSATNCTIIENFYYKLFPCKDVQAFLLGMNVITLR